MIRILAIVIAVFLPPLAVVLIRGRSAGFWLNLAGFAVAQGVFWVLFAGPGVVLWGLVVAHALGVALFLRRKGTV